jgi:hypothetical protein
MTGPLEPTTLPTGSGSVFKDEFEVLEVIGTGPSSLCRSAFST